MADIVFVTVLTFVGSTLQGSIGFGIGLLAAPILAPTGRTLVAAGVLSGLLGTIAAVGGPPLALLYQDAPGARIRSTISGFFLVGTIVSLVALWLVGRFGAGEFRLALIMLPGMLAGLALSRRTARYVDRGYTRPAVLAVVALTGLAIVVRQLV